jgi:trk system potassium uptake protein TrkH
MSRTFVNVMQASTRRNAGAERLLSTALFAFSIGFALMTVHAFLIDDIPTSAVFGICTAGGCLLASAIRMILIRHPIQATRSGLLVLIIFYAIGPLVAAVPFAELLPKFTLIDAYFEMSSALTTTGASNILAIEDVPRTLVLWRSLCAGFGGFVCLVAALSIFAPLSIGGFEVRHVLRGSLDGEARDRAQAAAAVTMDRREVVARTTWAAQVLAIPYCSMIIFCMLGMTAAGVPAFEALCYAFGAVSTTGFMVNPGGIAAYDSWVVELVLVLVIVPAAIGVATHVAALRGKLRVYVDDPECRYMLMAVGAVVLLLFMRHWIGAIETASTDEVAAGIAALWGSLFMAFSYITTAGFESASWDGATAWSGLRTPAIALLGLAIVGGGAASTSGGVKLIRAALLAKHSLNELGRLTRPTEIRLIRSGSHRITHTALRIVFVFVMLYVLAVVCGGLALTSTGMDMIDALVASISVLSNTGPLLPLITGEVDAYVDLDSLAKLVLCAGMIVGRMETLAVVALLSPRTWRK